MDSVSLILDSKAEQRKYLIAKVAERPKAALDKQKPVLAFSQSNLTFVLFSIAFFSSHNGISRDRPNMYISQSHIINLLYK